MPTNPSSSPLLMVILVALLAGLPSGLGLSAADFWERIGLKKSAEASALLELSEDQIATGLKEALANGIQSAIASLGKADGFLADQKVRIPIPDNLRKVEKGLRTLGQDKFADDFILAMNRAAEKAVPESAEVLSGAVRQMTIDDAKSIVKGSPTAATEFFRRTTQTQLQERLLPIVQNATQSVGVTSNYTRMTEALGSTSLTKWWGRTASPEALDLNAYVTRKALDGLFLKMGEEEKAIRENPAARTTDLLKRIFGGSETKASN
ncbi:MAG: DUF4197 domain-containing protein [Verrucomicrobiales bacterium]|nr:DUF4197 domain-containing protein [Verrucomicrobiales bacterium]